LHLVGHAGLGDALCRASDLRRYEWREAVQQRLIASQVNQAHQQDARVRFGKGSAHHRSVAGRLRGRGRDYRIVVGHGLGEGYGPVANGQDHPVGLEVPTRRFDEACRVYVNGRCGCGHDVAISRRFWLQERCRYQTRALAQCPP
jgi:hypothetical protein